MGPTLAGKEQALPLRAGAHAAIAVTGGDLRAPVELELLSILEGPAFKASSRSRAFLRFVVEETLSGRADTLKERTIGVAVLGRDHSYDTGADAVVRVRANDVRKRLSAHYEQFLPKAGYRIELPVGSYVPRFEGERRPSPAETPRPPSPPPMRLWQLAAPTVFALFMALVAIRSDADTSDSFTTFWSLALSNRDAIAVEVDASGDAESISPAMAEAAMPFSLLGASFQMPVHLRAATHSATDQRVCRIRLSTANPPPGSTREWNVGGVQVYYLPGGGPVLWLVGRNPEEIGGAAQSLSVRSAFPGIRVDPGSSVR
jgi:hypothetical protein